MKILEAVCSDNNCRDLYAPISIGKLKKRCAKSVGSQLQPNVC